MYDVYMSLISHRCGIRNTF